MAEPLVSIMIFNYNYGQYLAECFDSAVNQTYEHTEILFSDNCSTDGSWQIALDYDQKFPGKFFLARNRANFGTDANFANCYSNIRGKYYIALCSDDVLEPDFVSRTVRLLEEDDSVGLAMVHRYILDGDSNRTEEAPFYNQSCKIFPPGQSSVYMMAAVNPSISQIIYRRSIIDERSSTGSAASRHYGTRILDFNISTDFPIVYLKDALMGHRIHGANDSLSAADNLMEIIGFYVLNIQFSERAALRGFASVSERLPEATEKVSSLSVRYAVRGILNGDVRTARRYYNLALALHPEISKDENMVKLEGYFNSRSTVKRAGILRGFTNQDNLLYRTVSYDPPEPFEPIT